MRQWHIFLIALILWIPSAAFNPPTRQQELRVLISARNMLESGNFHRPEFQNQPRFRKPPMAYWLAAGGMGLTSETQQAWAGRLLFIINALAALWLLMKIAGPASIHAGLIAVFSFGLWRYAPLAETDLIQVTGILLFFFAWKRQSGLLAGLGISFACLSKGPGGFLIPFISMLFLFRHYRPSQKFVWGTLGIPLLLIGGWILILLGQESGLSQMHSDLSATFVTTAHKNPWYYYFYTLPLLMLPLGLLAFLPLKSKAQNAPSEKLTALIWFGVTFILLALTVSKQRHYALLLLPPAAWMIGMRLQTRKCPGPLWPMILACVISTASIYSIFQSDDFKNARVLKLMSSKVETAPTLHVVGINSAIFDFHLGRHVENTDSILTALKRANPGDAVIFIQKKTKGDMQALSTSSPALLQVDDSRWLRRLYVKQHTPDLDR